MKRRTFLKSAGSVAVVFAGGGVWRAYDQGVLSTGQGPAYEPWEDWRGETSEGPLALVRAGILAANPHNTQPWLFRVTETEIELYADPVRNLGAFDPYLREMHLGLGCAVENMVLAASANGYETGVTLSDGVLGSIPDTPAPALVARIDLAPAQVEASDLYEAIPKRHTNRGPYLPDRPLPPATLTILGGIAADDPDIDIALYTDEESKAAFGRLVIEATEAIIADSEMVHASERWFRHSWSDIQEFRDGPTLDAAGLPPMTAALAKMLPRPSADSNHQFWLDATRDVHVATAPVFGLISVRDLYSRSQNLRAGRVWQRMHLQATASGIAMQPLNQPVEMVDRDRELSAAPRTARALDDLVSDSSWRPTFAFRAGYAERDALPSPRRPVEQVVV